MTTVRVAQAYLDEIEIICKDDLANAGMIVGDVVNRHWGRGSVALANTLPLFGYCQPLAAQFTTLDCPYGCLTMIRNPHQRRVVVDARGKPVEDLTAKIKKDRKIARSPYEILPKRLARLEYPLTDRQAAAVRKRLLPYAVWQTSLRLRFKDVPRKQLKIRKVKC